MIRENVLFLRSMTSNSHPLVLFLLQFLGHWSSAPPATLQAKKVLVNMLGNKISRSPLLSFMLRTACAKWTPLRENETFNNEDKGERSNMRNNYRWRKWSLRNYAQYCQERMRWICVCVSLLSKEVRCAYDQYFQLPPYLTSRTLSAFPCKHRSAFCDGWVWAYRRWSSEAQSRLFVIGVSWSLELLKRSVM